MQFSLLLGVLAASSSVQGLIFRDKIVQDVDGTLFTLVHGVQEQTEVVLDENSHSLENNAWEFNTEGRADTDAVISPINSPAFLACNEGALCSLDFEGDKQAYRVTIVDGGARGPIFTFQDILSSLYVSRAPDSHYLELAPGAGALSEFKLVKIHSRLSSPLISRFWLC
jgi:hypothetical protein